jgi:hypothetical protein
MRMHVTEVYWCQMMQVPRWSLAVILERTLPPVTATPVATRRQLRGDRVVCFTVEQANVVTTAADASVHPIEIIPSFVNSSSATWWPGSLITWSSQRTYALTAASTPGSGDPIESVLPSSTRRQLRGVRVA